MNENNVKIRKQAHAFKGFGSSYNVEILNSFNPELQLKDTEFSIKIKQKKLLTELRGSELVTTLFLEFEK